MYIFSTHIYNNILLELFNSETAKRVDVPKNSRVGQILCEKSIIPQHELTHIFNILKDFRNIGDLKPYVTEFKAIQLEFRTGIFSYLDSILLSAEPINTKIKGFGISSKNITSKYSIDFISYFKNNKTIDVFHNAGIDTLLLVDEISLSASNLFEKVQPFLVASSDDGSLLIYHFGLTNQKLERYFKLSLYQYLQIPNQIEISQIDFRLLASILKLTYSGRIADCDDFYFRQYKKTYYSDEFNMLELYKYFPEDIPFDFIHFYNSYELPLSEVYFKSDVMNLIGKNLFLNNKAFDCGNSVAFY